MVNFVDEKGKVFFECNSTEARKAKEYVETFRSVGDWISPEVKKTSKKVMKIVADKSTYGNPRAKSNSSFLCCVADMFADLERGKLRVASIAVNVKTFTKFRTMRERDMVELETRAPYIKLGIMGYIWGAILFVSNEVPDNGCLLFSDDYNRSLFFDITVEEPKISIASHIKEIQRGLDGIINTVE